MTTTDDRQARTASDLFRFLPLALIISMFGLAVLLALVTSSRVTSDVYQVLAGEGAGDFRLSGESLTCSRTGDISTCTAPVAGQQLTIDVKYPDPNSIENSSCAARHGNRPVLCLTRVIGGQAPVSVAIPDQLGVTEPELTRLRATPPWWQAGGEPSLADAALLCGLTAAAAGVTTYLLNKRARAQEASWRTSVAAGTGVLGLAVLIASILVIAPSRMTDILPILVFTPAATVSAGMGAWQYQLGGAGCTRLRPRPALGVRGRRRHRDRPLHRHIRRPVVRQSVVQPSRLMASHPGRSRDAGKRKYLHGAPRRPPGSLPVHAQRARLQLGIDL